MKKTISAVALAGIICLCGCRSGGTADNNSLSSIAITEIAIEENPQPVDTSKPPIVQLETVGGGIASCFSLTQSSYCWESGNDAVCVDCISPFQASQEGLITVVIDTAYLEEAPRVLTHGGEITSVICFRDDITSQQCSFDGDRITLCKDSSFNVYAVDVSFPQGSCSYLFMTNNSLADTSKPPELKLNVGGMYLSLAKGGYEWSSTVTENGEEEIITTVVDCESPDQMYENGRLATPDLSEDNVLSNSVSVVLPDGAEITGVSLLPISSGAEQKSAQYSGNTISLPDNPNDYIYSIEVMFQNGTCSYNFAGNGGRTEQSTPAYDPS